MRGVLSFLHRTLQLPAHFHRNAAHRFFKKRTLGFSYYLLPKLEIIRWLGNWLAESHRPHRGQRTTAAGKLATWERWIGAFQNSADHFQRPYIHRELASQSHQGGFDLRPTPIWLSLCCSTHCTTASTKQNKKGPPKAAPFLLINNSRPSRGSH